ncbi:gluconokinase [Luteolibacter marinus]|uniref:gluconokinase n=1 Tax=Luteolibacter marinus TaxID=2776705 RepID=UPI0018681DBA|nr:gluconokinase [Luteolibacter marinus]
MKLVIAGVSGSGKSTIGKLVAERLGCEFADADDFHPPSNIAKMSAGIPLDDDDRAGWLEAIGRHLAAGGDQVLACSALKKVYRDRLRELAGPLSFFVLTVDRDEIVRRMAGRDHFMPASLLDSQFAILESGDDVTEVVNSAEPVVVAAAIVAKLG